MGVEHPTHSFSTVFYNKSAGISIIPALFCTNFDTYKDVMLILTDGDSTGICQAGDFHILLCIVSVMSQNIWVLLTVYSACGVSCRSSSCVIFGVARAKVIAGNLGEDSRCMVS